MKKLLLFMVVGFGGSMLVKGGHVGITPDNQLHVSQWTFPVPAAIQSSPVYGIVTAMLVGQSQAPANNASGAAGYGSAQPMRPVLPNVTSTNGTYNANAPTNATAPSLGQTPLTEQFNTVAKALR